jgi:hypothetical protein
MSCSNNLKQLGLAVANYAGANSDKLPPMLVYGGGGSNVGWEPLFFNLYPYIEQQNIFNRAIGTDGWGNGNNVAVVKPLLCPSDSSNNGGLCSSGATGWNGSSYAPTSYMFGGTTTTVAGQSCVCSNYTIGNIPDGTSNTVGFVERFASFPSYGWSNAAIYPQGGAFGWNSYGAVYGPWGPTLPQIAINPSQANPTYPNSAHSTCLVSLMDGSVRGVGSSVSQTTWTYAITPDDGQVLGSDW